MVRGGARAAGAALILALGLAGVAGCRTSELHDRYRAERMLFRADRAALRLRLGQQVVSKKDLGEVAAAYGAVSERFPLDRWTSADRQATADGRLVAHLTGRALLSQAQLLVSAEQENEARQKLDQIRKYLAGDSLEVQADYVEASLLLMEDKPLEAAALVASLPAKHAAVRADGQTPDLLILEAPLAAAREYARAGDADAARRTLAEGETLCRRVVAEHPGTPASLYARIGLFAVMAVQEEWDAAVRTMREILGDPQFRRWDADGRLGAVGRLRIAGFLAGPLGQPEDALAEVRRARDAGPPEDLAPFIRIAEAQILGAAGRYGEALAALDTVLTEYPRGITACAQALYTRGAVYEAKGDWERALGEYRTLVAKYPRTPLGLSVPLEIAARYERVGDRTAEAAALVRAIEDYRRVIELDSHSAEARAARENMAIAYAAQENWDQAAAALGDVAAQAAGTMPAANALWREAWIYDQKLGRTAEAEARLRQIVAQYPKSEIAEMANVRLKELGASSGAR